MTTPTVITPNTGKFSSSITRFTLIIPICNSIPKVFVHIRIFNTVLLYNKVLINYAMYIRFLHMRFIEEDYITFYHQ
jgi:hypothetical protein